MITALLVLLNAALAALAIWLFLNLSKIKDRFRPVLDLDAESERLKRDVATSKEKARRLSEQYQANRQLFDKLQQEVDSLQENLETMSFGLYKPHFDFTSSEKYKVEMERIYEAKKAKVKEGSAAVCATAWRVHNSEKEGAKMIKQVLKVMLRAFNGECDAAVSKVSWNNVTRMEERVRKAFEAINASGSVNNMRITPEYLDLCLKELYLTYEYEQKKQEEKDEQRRIREQMREEERAQREFEAAQRDAAKEQDRYTKALASARAEVAKATGEALRLAEERASELEAKLAEAQAKMQRALSMAQQTKQGYVYVISNIGSFGEDTYKIGMTRRLDPQDRVDELGDASVPFRFDVHAMIFSEDAPKLESTFHQRFADRRVNLVNRRKEFFHVSLQEVESLAHSLGVKVEFTHLAEAREFKESGSIRQQAAAAGTPIPEPILATGLPTALAYDED